MSNDKNKLSKELKNKLRLFIEDTSPMRVSHNLRAVLFGYLRNAREGMSVDLDMALDDMEALFDSLDVIANEKQPM